MYFGWQGDIIGRVWLIVNGRQVPNDDPKKGSFFGPKTCFIEFLAEDVSASSGFSNSIFLKPKSKAGQAHARMAS
jgi:hypothetical protein